MRMKIIEATRRKGAAAYKRYDRLFSPQLWMAATEKYAPDDGSYTRLWGYAMALCGSPMHAVNLDFLTTASYAEVAFLALFVDRKW